MIIGCDCDGVLTDMTEYICTCGEKWFKRKPSNLNGSNTIEIFNCTKREDLCFGLRYFFSYCKKWPPRKNASDVISKLSDEGCIFYEITARKFANEKNLLGSYVRFLFKQWIKNYNFKFKDVSYCSNSNVTEDKYNYCIKYRVDIMIEDSPDIALHLADKGIKVLLFDTNYNKNISHNNIIRVYSWEDIYEKITKTIH